MMKDVAYSEYWHQAVAQVPKGVFLTTKAGEKTNIMTIGWSSLGVIWRKPLYTVLVRYSRYTYELIEQAREFTVSIPFSPSSPAVREALAFCGTKSGREYDKFKECNLTPVPGKVISTPVVGEADLFYECKVLYQQAMEPALQDEGVKKLLYPDRDYHVIYYGEILACYKKE